MDAVIDNLLNDAARLLTDKTQLSSSIALNDSTVHPDPIRKEIWFRHGYLHNHHA
jgi:hypothetical protein